MKSRKFWASVITGAAIFVVGSIGLVSALFVPHVTFAAERLGADANWWLWVAGVAASTVLGYGGLNVWQKALLMKRGEKE